MKYDTRKPTRWDFSFEAKLAAISMFAVIIPLAIFVPVSIQRTSRALTDTIAGGLEASSILAARSIDQFIDERVADTRLLSHAGVLQRDHREDTIGYLTACVMASESIDDADVIDAAGKIIASSGEQNETGQSFWKVNPGLRDLFSACLVAQPGQVFVSEAQILDTGPGLLFVTPISDDASGAFRGALALEVNLNSIGRMLATFDGGLLWDKFSYIVDNAGRVLVTDAPSVKPFDSFPDLQLHPDLLSIFSQQGEIGHIRYVDVMGDEVLAGYADMGEFGENLALDWSIITIAPLDEITHPARETGNLLFFVGLSLAAIAALAVYVLIKRVTQSLYKFAAQVNDIANGNFSQRLLEKAEVGGVIGNLGTSINTMAASLKENVRTLEERERRLDITLNSIGDAVITTDTEGLITRMNPVAVQLTGWPQEESLGKSVRTVFPIVNSRSRETMENPVEKVLTSGEIVYLSNDTTLIAKGGREYQIADSAAPIRDGDAQILGMVLVFNDVTETYRLRRELEDTQRYQQALFDDMQTMVGVLDVDGTLKVVNNTPLSIAGLEPADVLGKKVWDCPWFDHDTKLQYVMREFVSDVAAGKSVRQDVQIRVSGGLLWIDFAMHPVRDENGNVIQLVPEGHDISARKAAEEQLRQSQKMEALGSLTGGIAHDYNNMLAVVLGYASVLSEELNDHPELQQFVHEIAHAGERATKLTRKLLSFSRSRGGEAVSVDLNTILRDKRYMLEKTLTVRVKLHLDLEDGLWPVWLDQGDMEDAIVNLSINAMHAMEGNGTLTIRTCNVHIGEIDSQELQLDTGDFVLLSVSDTGCGMDQKTKERIFEPFFSTKGDFGTGLGLSQVYGFVERSGGMIKVYSELGHGTQVTLYFPKDSEHSFAGEADTDDAPLEDCRGNETILVVDDESALLRLNTSILKGQGYRVIATQTAKEALEILERESIDLLLSDVIIPTMDGYQLAAIVLQKYPAVKIQLISGFSDERHVDNVNGALSANLLHKPCNAQVLVRRIRELLDS